jgi:magnesium-transporting ATPase (P-type)
MNLVPQNTSESILKGMAAGEKSAGNIQVNEVYLDGKLKKAELIDEDEKSYGIFMHSLILSNYAEVMKFNSSEVNLVGDDIEKAIFRYTASKGFDKHLIELIAPKVDGLTFEPQSQLQTSAHIINEKIRIVSKGTPEELLKRCSYILMDSKFVKITRRVYREVNAVLKDMISRSINVYAISIKDISKLTKVLSPDSYVSDMTLVALVGMGVA